MRDADHWTSKTRFVEPSTALTPHGARRRSNPSRSSTSSPVAGSTAALLTFASRAAGPAPSRGADLWWALLSPGGPTLMGFRRSSNQLARAHEQAALAYSPFGTRPLRAWRPYGRFTPGETPRHRDAASDPAARGQLLSQGSPRVPTGLSPDGTPFLRTPEPVELSPAGVSFELLRFADRARNRSALDPGKLLTDPSDGAIGFRAKKRRGRDVHLSNEA